MVASTNLFVRFSFHRPKMIVEGYAAPSEGEVCLLFSSFFIYPCSSFVFNYNNYFFWVSDHVIYFVCSMQGPVNNSSRWNSKQPAKRQPRRADIDGEADDD